MECQTCNGRGGFVCGIEEDGAIEKCVDCAGTGFRICDGCDARATHMVSTNYKSKLGAWHVISDYWCDDCDPTELILQSVRDM